MVKHLCETGEKIRTKLDSLKRPSRSRREASSGLNLLYKTNISNTPHHTRDGRRGVFEGSDLV